MISRVPFPNCRSGVIGLAIAGNPENDGHLSPWQEAVGHQIIPDTYKNGCANEETAALMALAAMLYAIIAIYDQQCQAIIFLIRINYAFLANANAC